MENKETQPRAKVRKVISAAAAEESRQKAEELAKNEFGDPVQLLSVAKMVAFDHYKSSEIPDSTIIEGLNILKEEEELRQKHIDTETCVQRLSLLSRYRDRYVSSYGGSVYQDEDGDDVINLQPSADKSREELENIMRNAFALQFAVKPMLAIPVLEYELALRIDNGFNIDDIPAFGVPRPISKDYGNFTDADYSDFYYNGQNTDNNSQE